MEILGIEHPHRAEEIRKRWEALGITSGLSGGIKEAIRQLYESENKPLSSGGEVPIENLPMVRRVLAKIDKIDDAE